MSAFVPLIIHRSSTIISGSSSVFAWQRGATIIFDEAVLAGVDAGFSMSGDRGFQGDGFSSDLIPTRRPLWPSQQNFLEFVE